MFRLLYFFTRTRTRDRHLEASLLSSICHELSKNSIRTPIRVKLAEIFKQLHLHPNTYVCASSFTHLSPQFCKQHHMAHHMAHSSPSDPEYSYAQSSHHCTHLTSPHISLPAYPTAPALPSHPKTPPSKPSYGPQTAFFN